MDRVSVEDRIKWLKDLVKDGESNIEYNKKCIEEESFKLECLDAAERVKAMYDAYVSVGFTKDQAYNFIVLIMKQGMGLSK